MNTAIPKDCFKVITQIPAGTMISAADLKAMYESTHSHTIAPCQKTESAKTGGKAYIDWLYSDSPAANQKEGNNPMNYNSAAVSMIAQPVNVEATQRDFYTSRINLIRKDHEGTLRTQFHMDAQAEPRSSKELISAITEGNYSLDEKILGRHDDEELKYYNVFYGIRWGKDVPDTKGHEEARKALKAASQDSIDAGTLSPIEGLLGLIKEFQSWSYEAPTAKAKK